MFSKSTITAALVALVLAASVPLAAQARSTVSQEVQAQITEMLVADGYEVRKIVPENGLIEVYALKAGQMLKLYLDSDLNIVRIKQK